MTKTVIGLFDTRSDADSAVQDLLSNGFPRAQIRVMPSNEHGVESAHSSTPAPSAAPHEEGFMAHVRHFFAELGFTEEQSPAQASTATVSNTGYTTKSGAEGTMVAVAADDDRAERAADILDEHGAVDIDERMAQAQPMAAPTQATAQKSPTPTASSAPAGSEVRLPVIEEELQVGKRMIKRGGVRIYSHAIETPVEEQVQLREEHVDVARRPVDRPVSDADLQAFKEGTIEITESAEEPIVAKQAHVVEEVVVSKQASQHTETIRDTVRGTQVEVEPLSPEQEREFAAYDTDFRNYYQSAYSSKGVSYDQLMPAYRYGYHLGLNPRYRGSDWTQAEPQLRQDWEQHNYGPWDRYKDAVHYAWDRARQH